jgi:hypothetical protein
MSAVLFLKLLSSFLISYGITQIIVETDNFITSFLRKFSFFDRMLSCYMCAGAWVGFIISFFIFSPSYILFADSMIFTNFYALKTICVFLDMMMYSCVIWFMFLLEKNIS